MATLLTLAMMPCSSPWLSAATWLDSMLFTDGPASPPSDDTPHQKYKAAELAVATYEGKDGCCDAKVRAAHGTEFGNDNAQ